MAVLQIEVLLVGTATGPVFHGPRAGAGHFHIDELGGQGEVVDVLLLLAHLFDFTDPLEIEFQGGLESDDAAHETEMSQQVGLQFHELLLLWELHGAPVWLGTERYSFELMVIMKSDM